ncbi:hypothetical protein [Streptomyces sp. NPDC056323]
MSPATRHRSEGWTGARVQTPAQGRDQRLGEAPEPAVSGTTGDARHSRTV